MNNSYTVVSNAASMLSTSPMKKTSSFHCRDLGDKSKQADNALYEARQEIKRLEARIEEMEDEIDDMQDELNVSYGDTIEQMVSQLQDAQNRLSHSRSIAAELQAQIQEIEAERDAARDQVKALEEKVASDKKKNSSSPVSTVSTPIVQAFPEGESIDTTPSKVEELEAQLQKRDEDVARLEFEVSGMKRVIAFASNTDSLKKINGLQEENAALHQTIKDLVKEKDELADTLDFSYGETLQMLSNQLSDSESIGNELREEIARLEGEVAAAAQKDGSSSNDSDNLVADLQFKVADMERIVKFLQQKAQQVQEEHAQELQKKDAAVADLEYQKAGVERVLKFLQAKVEKDGQEAATKAQDEIATLQFQLQESHRMMKFFQQKGIETESGKTEVGNSLKQMQDELHQALANGTRLQARLDRQMEVGEASAQQIVALTSVVQLMETRARHLYFM